MLNAPGPVTGRDIMCPADATIINPDWQLCTLAEGGRIRAEITVERGRGYVPADSHSHYKQAIDVIANRRSIHAGSQSELQRRAHSRRRINRFRQVDYRIWSNGSIDATEAISQAARQVIEHLLPIAELSGKPMVPAATQPAQTDGKHHPSLLKNWNSRFALTTASSEPISTRWASCSS